MRLSSPTCLGAIGCVLLLVACGGSAAPASSAPPAAPASAKPSASAAAGVASTAPAAASPASAAASAKPAASGAAAPSASGKLKVAILLPGPANDGGFDQVAFGAVAELKDAGFDAAYTESVQDNQQEAALRNYAKLGYDFIVGHGFQWIDNVEKVAADNPKIWFAVTAASFPAKHPNVASLLPGPADSSYLLGMYAGGMTKTNKIGAVIGQEQPTTTNMFANYQAGAKSLNPKVTGVISWVGDWNDTPKTKELATNQLSQGVDFIWGNANAGSRATVEAAAAKGVYGAGDGTDLSKDFPKAQVTSVTDKYDAMILNAAKLIQAGTFKSQPYIWGVKDGGTDVFPDHGLAPKDLSDKVDAVRQGFKTGQTPPGYVPYTG